MTPEDQQRFAQWLERLPQNEKEGAESRMLPLIWKYPDLLEDHSWPEIRLLADALWFAQSVAEDPNE